MTQGRFYARVAKLSAIITILPASMAGGWILGCFIVDRYFLHYPLGTILMILLGAGAGFYEIVRILLGDKDDAGNQGVG